MRNLFADAARVSESFKAVIARDCDQRDAGRSRHAHRKRRRRPTAHQDALYRVE
jgi:hypothetical protein